MTPSGDPARAARDLSEDAGPARRADVRVGSATDGLTPISVAERHLGAGWQQWLSLGAVAVAAIGADQLTKAIVSSQLELNEAVHVVGPFSIRHVQNSGIAFGLFASATFFVILLTTAAVAWMLYFFARSGSRHPILPVALGLVIGGRVSHLLDPLRPRHCPGLRPFQHCPASH